MLRGAFISLSKAHWAQRMITRWRFAWRVASRFIAGETPEEALQAVLGLNQQGINATLDHLGENTTHIAAADQAVGEILHILEKIDQTGLKCNVSIKLTQLGLNLDVERTYQNLLIILAKARELNNFVRVDMEDSSLTQDTLNLIQRAWDAGFKNTGAVIQAYLYRSEEDILQLVERGIPVRLVKGAYKEPSSLAYPRKRDVDHHFDRLCEILITGAARVDIPEAGRDGRFPPLAAIATHDEKRIRHAIAAAEKAGLPKSALEFQMLYGIRRELQRQLVHLGYSVRVYTPYGTHWYPYFMRRLAERPANVWFFLSNFFQR
jgi:proline dehydrogenase